MEALAGEQCGGHLGTGSGPAGSAGWSVARLGGCVTITSPALFSTAGV